MLDQLGWKAQTDEARLLRYALALAPETDFFIRKAIGWALRDHARLGHQHLDRHQRRQHDGAGLAHTLLHRGHKHAGDGP